ncbi:MULTISPECIES: hypothetical protein [Streptomyces]|uniref:DUF1453 domain-containing protein n=1 Tax=Streptomyces nondiastaticus TaxID=3154512 RepID=A0ABW6TST1_9ACTN|nr:hypothetical protein [Streptomyces sp. VNUA116]WKU48213.1 hypothetical protein Q3V23_31445 [Streptomyces sp. VNUA116]
MNNASIVIGIVIVALVIRRQLRTRPVHGKGGVVLLGILGLLGVLALVFGVASVVKEHPLGGATIALVAVCFLVAAGFGVVRARTVKVWRAPEGQLLRKGAPATTALWIVSIAVHVGLDKWIDHTTRTGLLGASTVYLYLAVTLAVQDFLVRRRAASVA